MPSHNNRKKTRRKLGSAGRGDNEFDITNNAFASAILQDDATETSSGVHLRDELVTSIMKHEAAVYDEQHHQQLNQDQSRVARARESYHENELHERRVHSGGDEEMPNDDYSFKPMSNFASSSSHHVDNLNTSGIQDNLSQASRRNNSNSGRDNRRDGANYSTPVNSGSPPQQRPAMPKRGNSVASLTSLSSRTGSLISSGISTIKVSVSELDKMIMQRSQSDKDDEDAGYEVPLPQMPHESRRASKFRLAIGIICMALAMTIALGWGQGKFGKASSAYFYNKFVLHGNTDGGPNVAIDETTKNGSHLFEKVVTLEKGFRPNVLGDPAIHVPVVKFDKNGNIVVSVPHEMTLSHYIEFVWVKEVASNRVVLARSYDPREPYSPILKARVPAGVKLRPYVFCNIHDLWIGEEFQVPAKDLQLN
jgi:desulfoferrodoxin (superoxide reductase-like protein)